MATQPTPLTYDAADFYNSAGWVIVIVPTGIFALSVAMSPHADPSKWTLVGVPLALGLCFAMIRLRYDVDLAAKTMTRTAGFGPIVGRRVEPLSEVRAVELGEFRGKGGSHFFTLKLDFVESTRKPLKLMIDGDDILVAQRAKDLANDLEVPLVVTQPWRNVASEGAKEIALGEDPMA
ncbi:MAG: hypothetical protein JSS65_08445 [Armatimonadetes bacterium]|nr:hypothetical protein [Armatimonadota bacterium]